MQVIAGSSCTVPGQIAPFDTSFESSTSSFLEQHAHYSVSFQVDVGAVYNELGSNAHWNSMSCLNDSESGQFLQHQTHSPSSTACRASYHRIQTLPQCKYGATMGLNNALPLPLFLPCTSTGLISPRLRIREIIPLPMDFLSPIHEDQRCCHEDLMQLVDLKWICSCAENCCYVDIRPMNSSHDTASSVWKPNISHCLSMDSLRAKTQLQYDQCCR